MDGAVVVLVENLSNSAIDNSTDKPLKREDITIGIKTEDNVSSEMLISLVGYVY